MKQLINLKPLSCNVVRILLLFLTCISSTDACNPVVSISQIPGTIQCYSITGSNSEIPDDQDSYYHWTFSDGTKGIGKTIYHCAPNVTAPTNYTFTLTYTVPAPMVCIINPIVSIYTLSLTPQSTCANNPTITLTKQTVSISVGPMWPETMFYFDFGDGSDSNSIFPTHTYANCGNYIIKIKKKDLFLPVVPCYMCAAVNIECGNVTGLPTNQLGSATRIYPNPAKNTLNIESVAVPTTIYIFNLAGQRVLETKEVVRQMPIDQLPPGMYWIALQFNDEASVVLKFIKE